MKIFNHFNPDPPRWMHVDFNSCFATIEQQANPKLRDYPIAVAAYESDSGCILAPSIEAKLYGVKTGMRVFEARRLCPQIKIMTADVDKYRHTHHRLKRILDDYSPSVIAKSIDEFALELPFVDSANHEQLRDLSQKLKLQIRQQLGEWLSVSVGLGPNRFLAKTVAGMIKPNGLVIIDAHNHREIYRRLELEDLNGIAYGYKIRLQVVGIRTVTDFYHASIDQLIQAFGSKVNALHWYTRLRGWQYDPPEFDRRSFGNSYSPKDRIINRSQLAPILMKLCQKTASRLRDATQVTTHLGIDLRLRGHPSWHRHRPTPPLFDTGEIYHHIYSLIPDRCFPSPVRTVSIYAGRLAKQLPQLDLFGQLERKRQLNEAIDQLNHRFGEFTVTPATMLSARELVPDRISFGQVGTSLLN